MGKQKTPLLSRDSYEGMFAEQGKASAVIVNNDYTTKFYKKNYPGDRTNIDLISQSYCKPH